MTDNILPFHNSTNSELLNLFSDSLPLSIASYENLYFDPANISDQYNRDVDPDQGALFSLINKYSNGSQFYDISDLRETLNQCPKNSLRIFSQNIRSLPKNIDEFLADICDCNVDILALSETWLTDATEQLYINHSNYKGIFKNRPAGGHGGVGFYLKDHLNYEILDEISLSDKDIECLFIRIKHNAEDIVLGSFYRPPRGSPESFLNRLSSILDYYQQNLAGSVLHIVGDFNLNLLLCPDSSEVESYVNLLFSYGLSPIIRRATRVTRHTATLLDHIWSNDPNVIMSGIVRLCVTDHFPVFVCRESKSCNTQSTYETVFVRNMCSSNKTKFSEALSHVSWVETLACENVDDMYSSFCSKLIDLYNECFPLLEKRKKKLDIEKPYITSEIRGLIKEKHRISKLFHKWPISYAEQYRRARNNVTNAVKAAKKNYYLNNLNMNERDAYKMWGTINEMLGCSGIKKSNITSLNVDDNMITDPTDISNSLNSFFSNVGRDLNRNFPDSSNFARFLNPESNSSFEFNPIDQAELRKIISGLRGGGSNLDNNVPMWIFKDYYDVLSDVLTCICNLSLATGKFPSKLSLAKVTCIHKSGDASDMSNYRPISVLPSFSKILEKVVVSQLSNHLYSNNLITEKQFGFRKGRSTEHAVHTLVKGIHEEFNSNNYVLCIFLDIKKAFDSLDRQILLNKLRYYGINGTEWLWFNSYLSSRNQYTRIGNASSNTLPVEFGVPQGGVVSSLLFLLFINDIANCSPSTKCVIYADDTSIYVSSPNIDELFLKANTSLSLFKSWFDANKLSLNVSKTQYMIFHRKQKVVPIINQSLSLNGIELKRVFSVKFLGIILDPNLDWNNHIQNVTRKVTKYVPILYRIRNLCTRKALMLIYNCLIYSNLIYCNSIWGFCKSSALYPLVIMQKKIVRAIAGVGQFHHTNSIFDDFRLLKLESINKYMSAIFVYKCLTDVHFSSWFTYREFSYDTRASVYRPLLNVPRISHVHSEQMISYRGPKLWNEIPVNILECNYNSFKFMYKSQLLLEQ